MKAADEDDAEVLDLAQKRYCLVFAFCTDATHALPKKLADQLDGHLQQLLPADRTMLSVTSENPLRATWVRLEDANGRLGLGMRSHGGIRSSADFLERSLHELMDLLPVSSDYQLDVIWATSLLPTASDTPAWLLGALKRAHDWHRGQVIVLVPSQEANPSVANEFLLDVRAEVIPMEELRFLSECLDTGLLWRGRLSFPTANNYSLPGLELLVNGHVSPAKQTKLGRRARLAGQLKVISRCARENIPENWISNKKYALRLFKAGTEECAISEKLLSDNSIFKDNAGIIVQLDHLITPDENALSTRHWKNCIALTDLNRPPGKAKDRLAAATFFFICNDSVEEIRGFSHRECLQKSAIYLCTRYDESCLKESRSSRTRPSRHVGSAKDVPKEEAWEDKRFLEFVGHLKKFQDKHKNPRSGVSSPTVASASDLVVMDAAEFVKLFTPDGNAALPSNLEPLTLTKKPAITTSVNEVDKKSWPDVLSVRTHDVYYNVSEESEAKEQQCVELQRKAVGERETSSTSAAWDPTVEPILVRKALGDAPRRSPRKKSGASVSGAGRLDKAAKAASKPAPSAANANAGASDDVYRKKLRVAVYDALADRGIDEKHALFRPCFRRLFEICKMYAKDIPANTSSTKQWLATVANQNAETVINLENAFRK